MKNTNWGGVGMLLLASCGGGTGGGSDAGAAGGGGDFAAPPPYEVLAANDLGMHCMDREFSVFSILPPFNVFHAQVIKRVQNSSKPVLLDAQTIDVRYSAIADPQGSRNSTSSFKTDFWAHAGQLFGVNLPVGQGLLGKYMPADGPQTGPQPMTYDAAKRWFTAEGVPITPVDDNGFTNPYPLLRVTAYAKNTNRELAHLDIVVPVAQETDCQNCHATGGTAADDPAIVWSTHPDLEVQTKENVLILHDARSSTQLLAAQPVLCASCHYSPALDLAGSGPQGGQLGHSFFSKAMHNFHGKLLDDQGGPVFPPQGNAATTCYQCHPGAITQCARGAMQTGGMECLNCHGGMLAVGSEYPLLPGGSIDGTHDGQPRRPWVDLPRCQSCHTGDALNHLSGPAYVMAADGIRLKQAYRVGDLSASPILAANKRFAESPATLNRFSVGHGGITCENCHGSTHAEWPNADALSNDNLASLELQGHSGPVIECGTCHGATTLPANTLQGPHGMHLVNDPRFIDEVHGELYEHNHARCTVCHGANLQGTVLSRAAAARTFVIEDDDVVHIAKGQKVSCTLCHEAP
jgi:hypothetical protein